jgi:hypothetical protein
MRQDEAVGKVLWVAGHGIAQVRNSRSVFGRAVVRHAEKEAEALRVVRVRSGFTVKRLEYVRSLFQIAGLEESQTEVELQAGHGGTMSRCLAIEGDRLAVVLLLRFEKAEMGEGLGVIGMGFQDGLPGGLSVGGPALLLQGEGGVTLG